MAMLGIPQILFAILFFIFIYYWRSNRNKPVVDWPIVGMLPGLLANVSNIHDHFTLLLMFKGPWLSTMNFLLTCDPMNLHQITCKKFSNYGKGSNFHEAFEVLGDGILNSDGETWKYNKTILHSIFTQRGFKKFFQKTMQDKLESCLFPYLDDIANAGIEVDIQDTFQKFIFDVICLIILGSDTYCLSFESPSVAIEKAFSEAEASILYRHTRPQSYWKLQKWLQIGKEKELLEAQKIVDQFLNEQIKSKRREQQKFSNNQLEEPYTDLLTIILAKEWGKGPIDDKFLRDTAINLLAAGRDTVSAGLSWFMWLIATHPSVEAKLIEELKSNFQGKLDSWTASAFEELNTLVYLHAAICETLRLYPSIPLDHKCAMEFDRLPSGHYVNSNTMVIYSIYSMGRMEKIWGQDCLEFKPERWISGKGDIVNVPSYKFMAFNAGPRSCMGKDMAFLEMKMIAAAILCNYKMQVVEGHSVCPSDSIVLHMKHGLKVRVMKR